ncbi:hypothetical protein DFJ74DRAFT_661859 [Hyaloraphidium curvatum]|nr:hypothetical protein DFJ74DRAFT_661859 [Hyaloraphidium curvatum]
MPREAVYTAHAAAATATLNSLLGSGPPWPRGAPGAREWASLVAALAEWPAGVEMGVRPSYYMFVRAAMKATRGVLVRLGCPAAEKWARTAPEVLIGGPVEPLGEEEGREALAAAVEAAAAVVLPPGFAESLEGSADEYDVLELADLMHLAAASAGELGMPGCAARAGEIRGRLLSLGGSHEELRRERAQRGLDMIS